MVECLLLQWNRMLFFMGLLKILMLCFVCFRLLKLDDEQVLVWIWLMCRSKNYLNLMYFGVFVVGVDMVVGILVFYYVDKKGRKLVFVFKFMEVQFLSCLEMDVLFFCIEGWEVENVIVESMVSGEWVNRKVLVEVQDIFGKVVVIFVMEISVKFCN